MYYGLTDNLYLRTHFNHIINRSGQRSVLLSSVVIGDLATVGAESCCDHDTCIEPNDTAFSSPLTVFKTSKTHQEIVSELMDQSMNERHRITPTIIDDETYSREHSDKPDLILPFWMYALVMNLSQFILPALIVSPYSLVAAASYFFFVLFFGATTAIILTIPAAFIGGSLALMLLIKCLQLLFGGQFTGTIDFYSVKFMCWYFLTDLTFLCTQTVFVPFAGTELFCMWLRLMGSKIGRRVFFSPENSGLRELDFLHVGDDCTILTANLNAHYADHGCLQFCPVELSPGCEINTDATVMPLTECGERTIIKSFAVTTKGQRCKDNTTYIGNPARPINSNAYKTTAVVFPGLGSAYLGVFKDIESYPRAVSLLREISAMLGLDVATMCSETSDPNGIEDVSVAQLIVTVINIISAEMMLQTNATEISQATIVAGFSVGEFAALYFAGAISLEDTLRLVRIQCDEFKKLRLSSTLCDVRGLSWKRVNTISKRCNCQIANVISCHKEDSLVAKNIIICGGKPNDIDRLVQHVNELGAKEECRISDAQLEHGGGRRKIVSAKRLRVNTANRE
jgi:acetyltransferase-like isoleucine patch superfamily enzyme